MAAQHLIWNFIRPTPILDTAATRTQNTSVDSKAAIHALFADQGGIELGPPPRSPGREPPNFTQAVYILDTNVISALMRPRPKSWPGSTLV